MLANLDDLAALMTAEQGKPLAESKGEIDYAASFIEWFAEEGKRVYGDTIPSPWNDRRLVVVKEPVGVCCAITPWNFPVAIPSWKLFPALICGNTVVFKPSSDTPMCAIELVKILEKAGIPPGVVNLVTGPGEKVGISIVRNKKVRAISFTGNRETGLQITKEAGTKRVGLEMGGKNPIIIMDDADLELALKGVIWGAFGTTGQRCTAASRVILHKQIKRKFETLLIDRARKLKLDPGILPSTEVGPLVNKAAQEKSQKYVEIGLKEGAKLKLGGKSPELPGFFFQATVFCDATPNMKIAQEEIFGPVVSLLTAGNIDEAIEIANSIEYGLSSSIYTKDINSAFKAIEKLDSGITYINASTIGAEIHLPFGGVKGTGNGTREGGMQAIEEFSEWKAVYFDYSGKLQRAQIDMD